MKALLKDAGFSDISIDYFRSLWIPFKGYTVPKGMIVLAKKAQIESSVLVNQGGAPAPYAHERLR